MDILIVLTETLTPLLRVLPAGVILSAFGSILVIILRNSKKESEKRNKEYNEIMKVVTDLQKESRKEFEEIREELDYIKNVALVNLKEEQLDNRKLTLRTLITNPALPIEYRLNSYDEYKTAGGNSWLTEYKNKYLTYEGDEN